MQLLFAQALEDQGLLEADGLPPDHDGDAPILVAWSDNGAEMTAIDTRQFMALMAITQHHGRPGTPTDQAHIESFFSHLKGDWPHLTGITRSSRARRRASTGSGPSTTRSDCTPRSGTSPPTTSTTAAGPASGVLAPPGCERARTERIKQNRASKT